MNKKLFALVAFLFLLSCGNNESERAEQVLPAITSGKNEIIKSKQKPDSIRAAIVNSKQAFEKKVNPAIHFIKKENKQNIFYLYYRKKRADCFLDSIIIYNKGNDTIIQRIPLKTADFDSWDLEPGFSVNEDVNFDGYRDIELLKFRGMYTVNCSYWVYNKKENSYKHKKEMDGIDNPVIDYKNKQIISEGHVGFDYTYRYVYVWKKGKLVEIEHNQDPF